MGDTMTPALQRPGVCPGRWCSQWWILWKRRQPNEGLKRQTDGAGNKTGQSLFEQESTFCSNFLNLEVETGKDCVQQRETGNELKLHISTIPQKAAAFQVHQRHLSVQVRVYVYIKQHINSDFYHLSVGRRRTRSGAAGPVGWLLENAITPDAVLKYYLETSYTQHRSLKK